jgi:hypothetical protein
MLIHRQYSYAPRSRRCTGRRAAQRREPVNISKNFPVAEGETLIRINGIYEDQRSARALKYNREAGNFKLSKPCR